MVEILLLLTVVIVTAVMIAGLIAAAAVIVHSRRLLKISNSNVSHFCFSVDTYISQYEEAHC